MYVLSTVAGLRKRWEKGNDDNGDQQGKQEIALSILKCLNTPSQVVNFHRLFLIKITPTTTKKLLILPLTLFRFRLEDFSGKFRAGGGSQKAAQSG